MTTLATRTETRPAVIDADFTITHPPIGTLVEGDLQYLPVEDRRPNPYRFHAVASALAMGGTGLGAGWSVAHDYRHADLAAGVFLLTILAFVLVMSRFNSFEQDC
jgi:hypothetical protein